MVPCPWPGGNTWWHDGEREVKALFPRLLLSKRKYGRTGGTSWPNRTKGLEETLQIPYSTFPSSSLSSGLSHFNGEMPQLRLTSTLGITLLSIEAGEQHQPVLLGTSSLPLCSVHEQSTSNVDWWEQISSWSLFAPLLILPTSGAAPTPTKYPLTPSKHNILHQKWKKKQQTQHCFPNNRGTAFLWTPTKRVLIPSACTKFGYLESFRWIFFTTPLGLLQVLLWSVTAASQNLATASVRKWRTAVERACARQKWSVSQSGGGQRMGGLCCWSHARPQPWVPNHPHLI